MIQTKIPVIFPWRYWAVTYCLWLPDCDSPWHPVLTFLSHLAVAYLEIHIWYQVSHVHVCLETHRKSFVLSDDLRGMLHPEFHVGICDTKEPSVNLHMQYANPDEYPLEWSPVKSFWIDKFNVGQMGNYFGTIYKYTSSVSYKDAHCGLAGGWHRNSSVYLIRTLHSPFAKSLASGVRCHVGVFREKVVKVTAYPLGPWK